MLRLMRSRRIVMLLGLVPVAVLLGAGCSGSGPKSASGIGVTSSPSHRGTGTSTTTTSTTTPPGTGSSDTAPNASPPPTPQRGNNLDSLLGTIESACSKNGPAPSACLCMTQRFQAEVRDNQNLDEMTSKLLKIMRECMKEH